MRFNRFPWRVVDEDGEVLGAFRHDVPANLFSKAYAAETGFQSTVLFVHNQRGPLYVTQETKILRAIKSGAKTAYEIEAVANMPLRSIYAVLSVLHHKGKIVNDGTIVGPARRRPQVAWKLADTKAGGTKRDQNREPMAADRRAVEGGPVFVSTGNVGRNGVVERRGADVRGANAGARAVQTRGR